MIVIFKEQYLSKLYEKGQSEDKKNREKLSGDKKNVWSARVNDKYRIEFEYLETGVSPQVAICYIKDLSNHYK